MIAYLSLLTLICTLATSLLNFNCNYIVNHQKFEINIFKTSTTKSSTQTSPILETTLHHTLSSL